MLPGVFAPFAVKIAASRAGRLLGRVPRWAWIALAVAVLGWLAWRWHDGRIEQLRTEVRVAAIAARDQQWQRGFDEMQRKAGIYKGGFLAASAREARLLRRRTDETLRRSAAAADDLRLQGPGRAAAAPGCRSFTGAADRGDTGRPGPAGWPADAPLAPVPDQERLALLPWAGTTRFAEEHDRYRAERNALIEHVDTQNRLIADLRAKLEAAVPRLSAPPAN